MNAYASTERIRNKAHMAVVLSRASPAMITLARRCGQVFGLDIYGVDTIQTRDGLMVIEVNEFPNFTSIPGAGEWIARFVLRRALGDMPPKRAEYGTTADRVLAPALSA